MNKNTNTYNKNGIYYVGQKTLSANIHCNSYLLIEEDMVVLFEPGSVLDFEDVYKNVTDLIDLEDIDLVFVSHPDPDLVSSLPMFEAKGLNARIICDWKTYEILHFYGIKGKPFYVDKNDYMLVFDSGRILRFIPAPFAHYSGNVIAYDEMYKTLFSGDLFGGYSKEWTLYAGEDYHEAMATYHENYMPSSDFIKPIMKHLLSLDIEAILPQHGSIIEGEMVRKSILYLYKLNFYNSSHIVEGVVNNRRHYNFEALINQILARLRNVFPDQEVLDVFEDSVIDIDPIKFEIISVHERKYRLWNYFFNTIYSKKGVRWLTLVESLVKKIMRIYHIKKPEIYTRIQSNNESIIHDISRDKEKLLDQLENLEIEKDKEIKKLDRCKVTNLRYTEVLKKLLTEDLKSDDYGTHFGVICVYVDNIDYINNNFSMTIGDETLRILSIKIREIVGPKSFVFRHTGPVFYIYIPEASYPTVKERAYFIRNDISESDSFVQQVTVSVSLVGSNELTSIEHQDQVKEVFYLCEKRLEIAKSYGGGHLIDSIREFKNYEGLILLIDEDDINRNILHRVFEQLNYEVVIARDVYEALNIVDKKRVDVIISEINLSKMDGFALKRNLNMDVKSEMIPFIMVSHNKNRDTIIRANQLNVDYIVKKPFYPEEIIGLVKRIREKNAKKLNDN